jgi:hypothetical protein
VARDGHPDTLYCYVFLTPYSALLCDAL